MLPVPKAQQPRSGYRDLAGVVIGLAESGVRDETVSVLRALLGRFAEIPPLAAKAATLFRRLDVGIPDGGWDPFLRSVADAVGEAVTVRESQREFDDFLEELTLQLEDVQRWTRWQAGAAQSRRAHAAGLLELRHTEARRQDEHERRASELSKEISELRGRIDELIKLCADQEARLMIDSLTGCHSRYAYERRLEEEFQRWQRHSQPLTFSVWDIDLFKRVNDSYGHEAGDRLLRGVAELFTNNKRAEDFLARIGGEEFALLLPLTTLEAATTVAEKLCRVVEAAAFPHHGQPVRVTMSAGLTDFRAGDTPTTVYERADGALYRAKQQGRNHWVAS